MEPLEVHVPRLKQTYRFMPGSGWYRENNIHACTAELHEVFSELGFAATIVDSYLFHEGAFYDAYTGERAGKGRAEELYKKLKEAQAGAAAMAWCSWQSSRAHTSCSGL
jgi:hypothetical protein